MKTLLLESVGTLCRTLLKGYIKNSVDIICIDNFETGPKRILILLLIKRGFVADRVL